MSSAHALLAPSSAARRMQCPASMTLEASYPESEDNPKAKEGVLAHEVIASVYNNGVNTVLDATEEMLDGAELWIDTVSWTKHLQHAVEERVDCVGIHKECWGTPDLWAYNPENETLYIYDYKFGHRYVDAFENWQMLTYANGCMLKVKGTVKHICMTIVQPRSYHKDGPVRRWVVTVDGKGYFDYQNQLAHNAEECMSKDPRAVTGGECRDCSARHACPTLQASSYSVVQMVGKNIPFDLPANALGHELAMLKEAQTLLDARVSGLEDEVLGRIKRGQSINGWMTEQGLGREKWSKPVEEVIALGAMLAIDISKPATLTPKQAIKAGLPAELVASYSETPKGEVKLVRDTGAKAMRVFKS